MKWRVVPLQVTNAFTAMAIDEAVSEFVNKGTSLPTIRFWRWHPSAVSIGYFQSLEDEINLGICQEFGVDFVRRRTGGGAVYHDYNGEITYSVIAGQELIGKGVHETYQIVCGWLMDGLRNLGLKPQYIPINDIVVNGKKISGNAQTRRGGIVLQHGTVLYDLDIKKMFTLLKVPKEKISDKMIKSVEERVTRILNFGSFTMEEVYQALLKGFTANKDWEFDNLTEEEMKRADKLAKTKYSSKEWNFMR